MRRSVRARAVVRFARATRSLHVCRVREFFTGPAIKTELMVAWLEKHDIAATMEFLDPTAAEDDLSREARVLVPAGEYDRAYQLFYADREDEL